jgi:hypothetical protein
MLAASLDLLRASEKGVVRRPVLLAEYQSGQVCGANVLLVYCTLPKGGVSMQFLND